MLVGLVPMAVANDGFTFTNFSEAFKQTFELK